MQISGFVGFGGAPGRVVCTFLRLRADCGLSSTAMGLDGLGVGVFEGLLSLCGGGGVLLMAGDGEGCGRFLIGVAGVS